MLPQFEDHKNKWINLYSLNKGFYLFCIGLAKKVLIADTISPFVEAGFSSSHLTFFEGWFTSISYCMQIYYDFSGYCDMAMGVALMFNIILPLNFNSPYRSTNFQEFWRRWHITLGRFFTNYLYIPLGGGRCASWKVYRNLIIVFLLSGLWHGAAWTFVIWGGMHGICILAHRIWQNKGFKMPKLLGWFITFNLVNVFWVFFRATTIKEAMCVLCAMFSWHSIKEFLIVTSHFNSISQFFGNEFIQQFIKNPGDGRSIILATVIFALFCTLFLKKNSFVKVQTMSYNIRTALETAFYFVLCTLMLYRVSIFLYFNF
jgi:alginate O-acetyltransferase complex protein AlgI